MNSIINDRLNPVIMTGAPQPLGVLNMRKSLAKLFSMNVGNFSDAEIDGLLDMAKNAAIEKCDRMENTLLTDPSITKDLIRLRTATLSYEIFGVIYLTSQNRVIKFEILSTGTLTKAAVYPRRVVESALLNKAGAVIFFHNHPGNSCEPSRADRGITETLVSALNLIEVKVLDHIVVCATDAVSFAERGWL